VSATINRRGVWGSANQGLKVKSSDIGRGSRPGFEVAGRGGQKGLQDSCKKGEGERDGGNKKM